MSIIRISVFMQLIIYSITNWVPPAPSAVANEPPSKKKRVLPKVTQDPVSARVKGNEIPEGKQPNAVLLDMIPLLAPNLAKRSSSIRKATLGFMRNFAHPHNSSPTLETVRTQGSLLILFLTLMY